MSISVPVEELPITVETGRGDHADAPAATAAEPLPMAGKIGSLGIFWELIEPILTRLAPRRFCEVGVESGAFTAQLLTWGRENGCVYVGIDPVVHPTLTARLSGGHDGAAAEKIVVGRSLEVLPQLERCGVYFLDGDHNYHTVRNELEIIAHAAADPGNDPGGPVIFVHDVGWPWGRRDMYYAPDTIPAEARHPFSEKLGVHPGGDDLIDGGLRDPSCYSIALHAGGPRNGVLTAVEDFLASDGGRDWEMTMLPAAYGLAILYRPGDPALPADCRDRLRGLHAAVGLTGGFLGAYEANYLRLYLYGEHARFEADAERISHFKTYQAYHALVAHGDAVSEEYARLGGEYTALLAEYRRLLDHCARLQESYERVVASSRELFAVAAVPPPSAPDA